MFVLGQFFSPLIVVVLVVISVDPILAYMLQYWLSRRLDSRNLNRYMLCLVVSSVVVVGIKLINYFGLFDVNELNVACLPTQTN